MFKIVTRDSQPILYLTRAKFTRTLAGTISVSECHNPLKMLLLYVEYGILRHGWSIFSVGISISTSSTSNSIHYESRR